LLRLLFGYLRLQPGPDHPTVCRQPFRQGEKPLRRQVPELLLSDSIDPVERPEISVQIIQVI
jgi:hypothetical protein